MSGPILDQSRRVELRGRAPRVDNNCRVTEYVDDLLAFQLIEPNVATTSTAPTTNRATQPVAPQNIERRAESQQGPHRINSPPDPSSARKIEPQSIQDVTKSEFFRLIEVPPSCQTARQLGVAQLVVNDPYTRSQRRGPACQAAIECRTTLTSQVAEVVDYLRKYPTVMSAISTQQYNYKSSNEDQLRATLFLNLNSYLSRYKGESIGIERGGAIIANCNIEFQKTNEIYTVNTRFENQGRHPFDIFVDVGRALLTDLGSKYQMEKAEYLELIASVDRYPGIERLEQAQARYDADFANENVPALLGDRSALLGELERARARKQLLAQQHSQISEYQQALSETAATIAHEGLSKAMPESMIALIDRTKNNLQRLGTMQPTTRGDVSQDLKAIASQLADIDSSVREAKSESDCNMLAANPDDPQRKASGVLFDKINPSVAVPACETAVRHA